MKVKDYLSVVSFVFLVLAVAHFVRIINGAEVTIASITIPLWISWIAIAVALYLSYQGYKHRR